MELLYYWINLTNNGFIEKQGFNFSPEFEFITICKDGKYILKKDEKWKSKKSIFKKDNIFNITAIIGKNGAGKTSLLKELTSIDCIMPIEKAKEGYEEFELHKKEIHKCIYIFREGESITVYHTLSDELINKTGFFDKNMADLKRNFYSQMLDEQSELQNISKIYISNSSFGRKEKVLSQQKKLYSVSLTPNSVKTLSKIFFSKETFTQSEGLYFIWSELVKENHSVEDFQAICDLVYYYRLIQDGSFEEYERNKDLRISVSASFYFTYQKGEMDYNRDKYESIDQIRGKNSLIHADNFMKNEEKYRENFVIRLITLDLIFELCLIEDICFPDEIVEIRDAWEWIEKHCQSCSNNHYIKNALKEIKELSKYLYKANNVYNYVPKGDLAYKYNLYFDYHECKELYIEFLAFINKLFNLKQSFVLKYLKLESIGLSSGERALQNLLSWIYLLPQFNNIDQNLPAELKDNVLILIDEADLYLHPEWQRTYVSRLINDIKHVLKNYKVQIIFSTHSPLCLSDIPLENTVFLDNKMGKLCVEKRSQHGQTFGKDVYSILNDSFYLTGTMGSFSTDYINDIISKMKNDKTGEYYKLSKYEIVEIEDRIDLIGVAFLKKKLLQMLKNCMDREDRLSFLKMQLETVTKEIRELEEQNDTI